MPEEDPSQPSLSLEEAIEATAAPIELTEAPIENETTLQTPLNEGPTHE
jgi:hypothetical protein